MTYGDSMLSEGERVVIRERQHPLAIVLGSIRAILLVLGALLLLWFGGLLAPDGILGTIRQFLGLTTLGVFVIGAALIALTTANWFNEEYLVTNRRVIKVSGLFNKHAGDSSLEHVNDAVIDQNIFGRMLGYGDLDIITANEAAVDTYKMLQHVVEFKREMLNQKHDLTNSMRTEDSPPVRAAAVALPPPTWGSRAPTATATADGSAPAASAPVAIAPAPPAPREMTPTEVTAALGGLADLRDRGAVTPEEFEKKKAELLSRL
jgi:hypothetical protein